MESSKKGHSIAELPDINLLYLLLRIFGFIFFIVAISLIVVPYIGVSTLSPVTIPIPVTTPIPESTTNSKDLTLFYVIAGVIVVGGILSMCFFIWRRNKKLRETRKSLIFDFSAEERALEKAGILRLPKNQNLPKSFWEREYWSFNDETVIKALNNERDGTDIAFWETSAILLLCRSQTQSRELKRKYPKIVICPVAPDEIVIKLECLKSNGKLTDKQKKAALERCEEIYESSRIVEAAERVVKLQNNLSENYQLRALDSFQLAAALVWCQEKPRRRPFVTTNEKLAEAAEKEGFTKILLT